MRALDDPENPYRQEYELWDLWLYMHEVSVLEGLGVVNPWISRPGWKTLYALVDENGCMVPQLTALRSDLERLQHGGRPAADRPKCTHGITARGPLDPRLFEAMRRAETALRAAYYPAIPAWLVDGAPQWAMLLPGGDVVTCGQVGNRDILEQGGSAVIPLRCYRYDAVGQLLGYTEPGQDWWYLYFDFDQVLAEFAPAAITCYDENGYIVVADEDSLRPLAVYDYDGSVLPADHPLSDRDGTRYLKIYTGELVEVFEAQQRATGRSA